MKYIVFHQLNVLLWECVLYVCKTWHLTPNAYHAKWSCPTVQPQQMSKLCDVILAIVKNLYQPPDSDLDKWTSRVPNSPKHRNRLVSFLFPCKNCPTVYQTLQFGPRNHRCYQYSTCISVEASPEFCHTVKPPSVSSPHPQLAAKSSQKVKSETNTHTYMFILCASTDDSPFITLHHTWLKVKTGSTRPTTPESSRFKMCSSRCSHWPHWLARVTVTMVLLQWYQAYGVSKNQAWTNKCTLNIP